MNTPPCRYLLALCAALLPACSRLNLEPDARLASSTTAPTSRPSQLTQLQGKWKVESAESGEPLVAGDHPWSLVNLTITTDAYTVRRADGTTEQGAFTLDESKTPAQVLFFNWGHKDEPRKAVFNLKDKTLKLCMYTKDFGEHSCLLVTPSKVELPPPTDPAYTETVLYTFTRE